MSQLDNAITAELDAWQKENKTQRLWASDASLWTNSDEAKWTGWLHVTATEFAETQRIEILASDIKTAGFKDIVVLGMGGSSLCPAMMAKTFGHINGHPRLHVLDSTNPQQIHHLENNIDLQKTLFIVSSKSGSTLESTIFTQYFYTRLQTVLGKFEVGAHFIAITDPDTKLAVLAKEKHFKAIFYGVPSIGGRYSALSNFGMVPAALMGVDVKEFLRHTKTMAQACAADVLPKNNPGVLLGITLGICANQGKDKITFIISPEIHALGAWLEQLIAESTGKNGKGIIPVDQEALGAVDVYCNDRVFVYIRLENAPDPTQDYAMTQLEQAGHIVIRQHVADKKHLGAELFKWEIATAVASSILGVNPFDQPDVEASKVRALQLTGEDQTNARDITQHMITASSITESLRMHFSKIKSGDYVDLAAFIEMSDENIALLQEIRTLIRDAKKVATCLGFGPRFLHSTGQAHKGGPNTGVFLQITADHKEDIQIPNHHSTFDLVIDAQAQADFEVLTQRSRRILRVHLGSDVRAGLQQLHKLIIDTIIANKYVF